MGACSQRRTSLDDLDLKHLADQFVLAGGAIINAAINGAS